MAQDTWWLVSFFCCGSIDTQFSDGDIFHSIWIFSNYPLEKSTRKVGKIINRR